MPSLHLWSSLGLRLSPGNPAVKSFPTLGDRQRHLQGWEGGSSSLVFTPQASDIFHCHPLQRGPSWKEEGTRPFPATSVEHPIFEEC